MNKFVFLTLFAAVVGIVAVKAGMAGLIPIKYANIITILFVVLGTISFIIGFSRRLTRIFGKTEKGEREKSK